MSKSLLSRSLLPLFCVLMAAVPAAGQEASAESDLEAARELFDRNLEAIRQRDREAYLSCYLQSERFTRVGPMGQTLGYESHAAGSSDDNWPDIFEALDLKLTSVRPGIVFGTYRYRVRYGPTEVKGLSERIFLETEDGWKIAMTSAFSEPEGIPPVARVFTTMTLIDGTGAPPVKNAVVVMRSGIIECAGSREECPVPDDAVETPLPGHWVTPGLIDAHVHFSQTGFADGRPDFADIRKHIPYESVIADLRDNAGLFLQSHLCSGVTGVFDVGGYPWTLQLPGRAENDTLAPHVVSAGPILAPVDADLLNLPGERQIMRFTDAESAEALVRYVKSQGSQALKIWWVNTSDPAPEVVDEAVKAAAAEAERLELPVIVHATSLERAKAAIRAGASMLVHSVEDEEVDQEFLDLAKDNDVIYCPTLTVRDGYRKLHRAMLQQRAVVPVDPLACVDPRIRARLQLSATFGKSYLSEGIRDRMPPSRLRVTSGNLLKVSQAGIRIAMGTDAGNPLTLHGDSVFQEMMAMEKAGLSPMEVIVAATRGSAAAMGRLGDLGTVERGKAADLLVLGADPTETVDNFRHLTLVVRGGVVRHQVELRAPEE